MSCTGIQVQPGCCNCVVAYDGSISSFNIDSATCIAGGTTNAIYDATTVTQTQLARAKMLICGVNGGYTPELDYSAGVKTMFKDWLLAGGRMFIEVQSYNDSVAELAIANNFLGFLGSGMQFAWVGGTRFRPCNNLPQTCGAWTARLQAQPIVTGLTGTLQYFTIGKVTGGTSLAQNQAETVSPFADCNGVDFSFLSAEKIGDGIVFCCATRSITYNCMTTAPDPTAANCEFARRVCKWPIADMLV